MISHTDTRSIIIAPIVKSDGEVYDRSDNTWLHIIIGIYSKTFPYVRLMTVSGRGNLSYVSLASEHVFSKDPLLISSPELALHVQGPLMHEVFSRPITMTVNLGWNNIAKVVGLAFGFNFFWTVCAKECLSMPCSKVGLLVQSVGTNRHNSNRFCILYDCLIINH